MGSDKIPGRTTSVWRAHGSALFTYDVSYLRTRVIAGSAKHDKGIWGKRVLWAAGFAREMQNSAPWTFSTYRGIMKILPREGFLIVFIHGGSWVYKRDDSSHFGVESREYAASD